MGPCKYIFSRFGPASKKVREQIFGLGRPAGHRAAAAGSFKKADPWGPKRLGSRESTHAGQSVPAPHLVPSRSLDRRLVCPGPSSGCPQRVRVRPGLINRAFGRCIGQRPDPLDEGQVVPRVALRSIFIRSFCFVDYGNVHRHSSNRRETGRLMQSRPSSDYGSSF